MTAPLTAPAGITCRDLFPRRDLFRGAAGLAVLASLAATSGCRRAPQEARSSLDRLPGGDPGALPAAAATLTARVLQAARSGPANLVLSPFSVQVALSMVRNGAVGATADEMDRVLGIDDLTVHNEELNSTCQLIESRSGEIEGQEVAVELANSLWGQQGLEFAEPFLDALAQYYGAGMALTDFAGDSAGAVDDINAWVDDRTHGLVPEIVTTDLVHAQTRLVLVNALYLKAPWAVPFDESATSDGPFTTGAGDQVQAPMMSGSTATWYEDEHCTATRRVYLGNDLAMAVAKPKGDIAALLEHWAEGGLTAMLDGWERAQVRLQMPRWEHEWRGGLAELLAEMGMATAFSDKADFSAMTAQERLLIGFVEHRATISVDESGTEAAAATAVGMEPTSAEPERSEDLVLDRDFAYVIHDVETGTPLFIGVVDDPTA